MIRERINSQLLFVFKDKELKIMRRISFITILVIVFMSILLLAYGFYSLPIEIAIVLLIGSSLLFEQRISLGHMRLKKNLYLLNAKVLTFYDVNLSQGFSVSYERLTDGGDDTGQGATLFHVSIKSLNARKTYLIAKVPKESQAKMLKNFIDALWLKSDVIEC